MAALFASRIASRADISRSNLQRRYDPARARSLFDLLEQIAPRRRAKRVDLPLERAALLDEEGRLALRVATRTVCALRLSPELRSALLERSHEALEATRTFAGERARAIDDGLRNTEVCGDVESARALWQVERDLEGRAQARRVEADARVSEPSVDEGDRLQPFVVRRHDDVRSACGDRLEHRLRERLALRRIGVRGDFVDEHERAFACVPEDVDDLEDVCGEGRQVRRDRLPIADRDLDVVEPADARSLLQNV